MHDGQENFRRTQNQRLVSEAQESFILTHAAALATCQDKAVDSLRKRHLSIPQDIILNHCCLSGFADSTAARRGCYRVQITALPQWNYWRSVCTCWVGSVAAKQLVPRDGVEPPTPAFSGLRSTT